MLRIEIDHHLAADSDYFGDEGYRFVTEASSASELIGHILLKLDGREELLERHQVTELFPRNLVLAILTGIIGDSNMGQYLKSRREKRSTTRSSPGCSTTCSPVRTTKKTNFFTMDQVFSELQKLSTHEEGCYSYMMERKKRSVPRSPRWRSPRRKWLTLYASCDDDTIVSTARVIADTSCRGKLASSGSSPTTTTPSEATWCSSVCAAREAGRSTTFGGCSTLFSIANGGGHEGAIGFRIPRAQIPDFHAYVSSLVEGIEAAIKE